MREWCGCGAGISGKPKAVKRWRTEHQHGSPVAPAHPPTSGGSSTENTWPQIGFRAEVEA